MKGSLFKLKSFIETSEYRGYDPYDALNSPFFKIPILNKNKLFRFGMQQLVKRLPFNIRPLLLIPKGYNPVTLGLSIQAYAYLYQAEKENRDTYTQKIEFLISELEKLIPKGFSGACWGYDFDWEARHAKIPAYQPTVVATGIITNALFIANQLTGIKKAKNLVESAANFVVKDLNRTYEGEFFCFSYSPFDQQQVFNASMKGVRLLSQAYWFTHNVEYKQLAKKACEFVIKYQNENGSWGYSLANSGGWTDNYHTGYILDCLDEYQKLTQDEEYISSLYQGFKYYKESFFDENGFPSFYDNKKYPLDCTAASQSILSLLKFGETKLANQVALTTVSKMQKNNGSFRFRKFKYYTISTSFMRWSNAWMFAALAYLKYKSIEK